MWSVIAKSLGQKSGKNKRQSDIIAILRLFFVLQIIMTNGFIVYGVVRTHIFPATPKVVNCIIDRK